MTGKTDRIRASRVLRRMTQRAILAATVAGVSACGSKPKQGTTPAGTTSSTGTVPGATSGDTQSSAEKTLPPGPTPPGLDLTPAERAQAVAGHLATARRALTPGSRNPDVAIRAAQKALQVDETNVDAMLQLAHANYLKGYLDLAEDILDKAAERGGSQRKELHFLRGLIYERTDRADKALIAFEEAVSIDPDYRSGLLNLGGHYLRNKRYTKAVQLYERLTGSLGDKRPAALTNLASAYRGLSAELAASDVRRRNELILKAESTYKTAIASSRSYGPAYYNLGLLFLDADPYPTSGGDMDKLQRLKQAKSYFDTYRGKPGADTNLAKEQASLAQKLYDREQRARRKLEEAERRRKEAEKKAKEAADVDFDDDEGFE